MIATDFQFGLGDKVKDQITGFKGIVVCRAQWLNCCNTYTVKSVKLKDDGSTLKGETFDEPQLELIKLAVIEPKRETGGPARAIERPHS